MPGQEERRQFARLNILTDVNFKRIAPSEKEKLSLLKNIGLGGICLIAYEELKPNDMLELEIYLPEDKTPIKTKGRVVWVKEFIIGDPTKGKRYDAGIEFIDAEQDNIDKINRYVFGHI